MSNPTSREAVETLRSIEELQARTSNALRSFWFPLVLFGALTLISAPLALVGDGWAPALFWAAAGPLGGMAVAWYYRTRELRLGLRAKAWPYLATAGALMLGAFLLPVVTSGHLQEVVSFFAIAPAYLVFAALDRSRTLAVVAVVIGLVPAIVLVAGVEHPGAVVAAVNGAIILAIGVAARPSS